MVASGAVIGEQRDVGAHHRVDLVLDHPQLALARRRLDRGDAASVHGSGRRGAAAGLPSASPSRRPISAQQLGAQQLEVAARSCSCTSASGRAGTARPSPGAGRPRSRAGARPERGFMSRPERVAQRGAARVSPRTRACRCWTGARRRRTGRSPGSARPRRAGCRSRCARSAARRWRPGSRRRRTAPARSTISSSVRTVETCTSRPSSSSTASPVGLGPPGEVDSDVEHAPSLPYGPSYWPIRPSIRSRSRSA